MKAVAIHFKKKWGWYALGLLVLIFLEKILSGLIYISAALIAWYVEGYETCHRPIASLSISDIFELIFRVFVAWVGYHLIKTIVSTFNNRKELSEDEF